MIGNNRQLSVSNYLAERQFINTGDFIVFIVSWKYFTVLIAYYTL